MPPSLSSDPIRRVLGAPRAFADALPRHGVSEDEISTVSILLDAVRTWAGRHIDSAAIDAAGRIPAQEVFGTARELGLYGLTIPEDYDGAGLSMKAAGRVIEEIATFDRSVAVSIGLHNGLGIRGLVQYGSEELKRRYLPKLATGELVAAFAATEPNAGSDIASVATVARMAGEQTVRLNGSKIFVTNGGFAGTVTVIARSPGMGGVKRGHSLFLVPVDRPGVVVGKEEHKLGLKGSSTTTIDLDDVELDVDHVIGEPSKGLDLMNQVLAWGRTLMAAGCLGAARASFRLAAEYAVTRQQFGRPIGRFGQVAEKVARMRALLYAMESLLRQTNHVHDGCGGDITWESSILKVFNSEAAGWIADEALQIHGGAGFIEETGLARVLRDCRITRIFEGANEVLRFHLASAALGFVGKAGADSVPLLAGIIDEALAPEAARFDTLLGATREAVRAVKKRHGFRVFERQTLLAGLADAWIGVYTLLAVVLRTDGELRRHGPTTQAEQKLDLARYLTRILGRRVERGLAAAGRDDEEALVTAISAVAYAPYE